MKTLGFYTFLLCLFIYGCKKKDKDPVEETPAVPTENTNVYGNIQANYLYSGYNNTVTKDSSVAISFFSSPFNVTTMLDAGTVSVNNQTLGHLPSMGYQNQGAKVNLSGALNWSVSGSPNSTVTPFTYSYVPVMPQYTGYTLIPDTFSKSAGVSLTISGMSNVNTGSVGFLQGQQSKYKQFSGNGTITFTAEEIAGYKTGGADPIFLTISGSNIKKVKIGTTYYNLFNSALFYKNVYLK